jgi:hypothetical protein
LGMARRYGAGQQREDRDADQPAGKRDNHVGVATPVEQTRRK